MQVLPRIRIEQRIDISFKFCQEKKVYPRRDISFVKN
jgi:hypothetical protein